MKVEHLGELVEIDPKQAALEHSIVNALRNRGVLKQRTLWFCCAGQRSGPEGFKKALDHLVEKGHIVRMTTNRSNSFTYRLVGAL